MLMFQMQCAVPNFDIGRAASRLQRSNSAKNAYVIKDQEPKIFLICNAEIRFALNAQIYVG